MYYYIFSELQQQLKAKDTKINELQKEIYEIKLEKVDQLKKELEEKLKVLQWPSKVILDRKTGRTEKPNSMLWFSITSWSS